MAIPARIIQTHRDTELGRRNRQSWIDRHPAFEYRFFDDLACEAFIREHDADLLTTWQRLPLPAQRADFFRYLAIYHLGGIYSDVDTLCKVPVTDYIDLNACEMAVGLEMSVASYRGSMGKYLRGYLAPRQFTQWTFAASPGHPVLLALLRNIHRSVSQFSDGQLRDCSQSFRFVLELTGPIAFTQAVRFHAAMNAPAPVYILPQLCWGYCPHNNADIDPLTDPAVKVIHYYRGSWKKAIHW